MNSPGHHRPATRSAVVALLGTALAAGALAAQDTTRTTAERLDELDQKIKVLQRLDELATDSAAQASRGRPSVSAGTDGFQIRSADGRWRVRLTGYFQADSRWYPGDDAETLTDQFMIRRARPMVEGTLSKYFEFRIMPDLGGGQVTLYEGWLEARLSPAIAIRGGKFKPPVGLERLQSATDLRFIERGFPTNLAPNRDAGVQLSGEIAKGVVSWQVGLFNGVPDLGFGDTDANDAKDLAGRIFITPFAPRGRTAPVDLGFGIAGTTGNERGTVSSPLTSNLRTPGQATAFRYRTGATVAAATIADGRRTRVYPQAYLYAGSFGFLAEYSDNKHTVRRDTALARIHHDGWQVSGSVFLTGEKASYRSVTPKKVFDPKAGTIGAIELALRYQQTGVDQEAFPFFADPAVAVRNTKAWSVGLNWHFAKQLKLMVNYERATFEGGAATGDRPAESFLATRFQFAY